MKYADRRNSPCAIIQGSDEKANGKVQIKDLIEGAKAGRDQDLQPGIAREPSEAQF